MPNFTKTLEQLETKFEKWMFAIKNLSRLDDKPTVFRDAVFEAFFKAAEVAAFSEEERESYEQSLKYYRDINNVIETARSEGRDEAMLEATQTIRMTEEKLEDERRQKEEAQKREEALAETAINALMTTGMSREDARKQLGLA